MPDNPAPLLTPGVVEQTKRVAAAVRASRIAPLVGAGLSMRSGLRSWGDLVDRLILAWKEADPSPSARKLAQDNYVRAVRRTFDGSDLAIVSYLRGRIDEQDDPGAFGRLLWSALYSRLEEDEAFTPEPNHLHRHLVSLFCDYPRRLWTTNYDDLLEEAARLNGVEVSTLDPKRRLASDKLLVTHLHGFLAPDGRDEGHPGPDEAPVVLAEDDYHLVAAGAANWTDQGYYRLFGEHGVLIMGMSLGDPNLRRVLSILSPEQGLPNDAPQHFAAMTSIGPDQLETKRIGQAARRRLAADANEYRRLYWARRSVEVIELPNHESISSFLMRLRYESFGDAPGNLWRKGAELGYAVARPWRNGCQQEARSYLAKAIVAIRQDFAVDDPSEIVELGVFLLKPGGKTLELVFRAGGANHARQGAREFSADPDGPTGLAGRVLASGEIVAVPRDHPLHDYGLSPGGGSSPAKYRGIISGPVVDWGAGGVPLGIVYLTTSRVDGALFGLTEVGAPGERSLVELHSALSALALDVIGLCKKTRK